MRKILSISSLAIVFMFAIIFIASARMQISSMADGYSSNTLLIGCPKSGYCEYVLLGTSYSNSISVPQNITNLFTGLTLDKDEIITTIYRYISNDFNADRVYYLISNKQTDGKLRAWKFILNGQFNTNTTIPVTPVNISFGSNIDTFIKAGGVSYASYFYYSIQNMFLGTQLVDYNNNIVSIADASSSLKQFNGGAQDITATIEETSSNGLPTESINIIKNDQLIKVDPQHMQQIGAMQSVESFLASYGRHGKTLDDLFSAGDALEVYAPLNTGAANLDLSSASINKADWDAPNIKGEDGNSISCYRLTQSSTISLSCYTVTIVKDKLQYYADKPWQLDGRQLQVTGSNGFSGIGVTYDVATSGNNVTLYMGIKATSSQQTLSKLSSLSTVSYNINLDKNPSLNLHPQASNLFYLPQQIVGQHTSLKSTPLDLDSGSLEINSTFLNKYMFSDLAVIHALTLNKGGFSYKQQNWTSPNTGESCNGDSCYSITFSNSYYDQYLFYLYGRQLVSNYGPAYNQDCDYYDYKGIVSQCKSWSYSADSIKALIKDVSVQDNTLTLYIQGQVFTTNMHGLGTTPPNSSPRPAITIDNYSTYTLQPVLPKDQFDQQGKLPYIQVMPTTTDVNSYATIISVTNGKWLAPHLLLNSYDNYLGYDVNTVQPRYMEAVTMPLTVLGSYKQAPNLLDGRGFNVRKKDGDNSIHTSIYDYSVATDTSNACDTSKDIACNKLVTLYMSSNLPFSSAEVDSLVLETNQNPESHEFYFNWAGTSFIDSSTNRIAVFQKGGCKEANLCNTGNWIDAPPTEQNVCTQTDGVDHWRGCQEITIPLSNLGTYYSSNLKLIKGMAWAEFDDKSGVDPNGNTTCDVNNFGNTTFNYADIYDYQVQGSNIKLWLKAYNQTPISMNKGLIFQKAEGGNIKLWLKGYNQTPTNAVTCLQYEYILGGSPLNSGSNGQVAMQQNQQGIFHKIVNWFKF